MAIIAKSTGSAPKELIPAGNYIARCYQLLDIGTVDENIMGDIKHHHKLLIGFELPNELKVFSPEKGEQPLVISKFFTLSLHEKASLRIALKSWRGKDFTEQEAEAFDVCKLLGAPCMLNIIHKASKKDANVFYEEVAGITPMPKGIVCPPQINANQELSFDSFNRELFDSLPEFLQEKIKGSDEYKEMMGIAKPQFIAPPKPEDDDSDLPF